MLLPKTHALFLHRHTTAEIQMEDQQQAEKLLKDVNRMVGRWQGVQGPVRDKQQQPAGYVTSRAQVEGQGDTSSDIAANRINKVVRHSVEPARKIPVLDQCDVLVVGGGPSGLSAAIGAARAGADVILMERYSFV